MNDTNQDASQRDNGQRQAPAADFRQDLSQALDTLRKGGIILYPTDTVWGIGCDATNPEAVKRIYGLKQRADSKAMIVMADSPAMAERYVDEMPDVALQLMEVAVKPTTIIYDRGIGLAPNLLAPDGSVGIRVTSEPFSAMLCRRLRRPLVSTSPRFFNEIPDEIVSGVDYVVNYRRDDNTPHTPSSIIKLSNSGEVKIIRK